MEKPDDDSNLPTEIICFEILPRIPRASLVHFQCVSNSWNALLNTNPGFWRIHRNFHPRNTGHLLLYAHVSGSGATGKDYLLLVKASQDGNTPSHVTDLMRLPCSLFKTKYANGLVLGDSAWNSDPTYIFNLCTRESVIVPNPTFQYDGLYFGCSPSTNEYKVVATHDIEGVVGFKIFTLGQASWRNIMVDWHHLSFVRPPPSDFCRLATSHEAILALDIGDERFTFIPVPSQCKLNNKYKKTIEVDGCLGIVCGDYGIDVNNVIVLWILMDYRHQVWVAETIKVNRYGPYRLRFRSSYLPQCTTHTGELVFEVTKDNYLQLYDRKSKSFRQSKIIFPEILRDLGLRLCYSAVSFDDCATS
ncbi:hypothetical protein ACLB2K_033626 [Fragaria x ananassa]